MASLACLALGLAGVGCGEDENGGDGDAPDRPVGGGAEATPGSQGNEVQTIRMRDIKYFPENARVPAGKEITWINDDQVDHTVTKQSGPGPKFDSGIVGPGETYRESFDAKGKIGYFCTVHPNQKGTLTVVGRAG